MRIISGIYKSRLLASFKHLPNLRPTTDKVKEAIFDILGNRVASKNFLDTFAGTGQIGLEAISRGANKVFFLEKNKANIALIKKNIDLLKIKKDKYKILNGDVFKILINNFTLEIIDIIFFDPPYNKGFVNKILFFLKKINRLNNETLIIFEHSKEEIILLDDYFNIITEKRYGDTKITFLSKNN